MPLRGPGIFRKRKFQLRISQNNWRGALNLTSRYQKIAFFGGTFDPPHLAHRRLIETLLSQGLFDEIIVVPSRFPPGKSATASYEERMRWTKATFAGLKGVTVSAFEAHTQITLFGIDIYHHFLKEKSSAEFFWILGDDQWEQLAYWRQIDAYASGLTWIVLRRQSPRGPKATHVPATCGLLSRRLSQSTCAYRFAESPLFDDISSSSLREQISRGHVSDGLKWLCESIRDEVMHAYHDPINSPERRTH